MGRHRRLKGFAEEGGPDLAPLIDCVFLLLIFFMVTTVFLHTRGLEVDMPARSEATEEQKKDINVVLDREGKIQIKGDEVSPDELGDRLVTAMEEANNENIIIQADGDCPQEHVVFVVDTGKRVGVVGIAFAREQEEE